MVRRSGMSRWRSMRWRISEGREERVRGLPAGSKDGGDESILVTLMVGERLGW